MSHLTLMARFNAWVNRRRGQISAALTSEGPNHPPLDLVFFLDEIGAAGPPGTLARGSAPP